MCRTEYQLPETKKSLTDNAIKHLVIYRAEATTKRSVRRATTSLVHANDHSLIKEVIHSCTHHNFVCVKHITIGTIFFLIRKLTVSAQLSMAWKQKTCIEHFSTVSLLYLLTQVVEQLEHLRIFDFLLRKEK